MELTTEELKVIKKTLNELNVESMFKNYISIIEKDIFKSIEKKAIEHGFENEYKNYIYNSITNSHVEKKDIFQYLFYKIKEHMLLVILDHLIIKYDIRINNYTDSKEVILKTILYTCGENFDKTKSDISNYNTLEKKHKTMDSDEKNLEKLINWLENDDNITELNFSKNKFCELDHIYNNIFSPLNYTLFLAYPSLHHVKKYNSSKLPKSSSYTIALISKLFYSPQFGKQNIYSSCKTVLTNTLHSNDVRTIKSLISQYNRGLCYFRDVLSTMPTNENHSLDYNLLSFNMNRIFKTSFVNSLSHPLIKKLFKNIDLPELITFLSQWYENSNESGNMMSYAVPIDTNKNDSIPFEIISSSYNLSVLEQLANYNLDISSTNVSDILSLNLTEVSFLHSEDQLQLDNEFCSKHALIKQNIKLNNFYQFIYELLNDCNDYLIKTIHDTTSVIFNYFTDTYLTHKNGQIFIEVFDKFENSNLQHIIIDCLTNLKKDNFNPFWGEPSEKDMLIINTIIDYLFDIFIQTLNKELHSIPTLRYNKDFSIKELDETYLQLESNLDTFAYLLLLSANYY